MMRVLFGYESFSFLITLFSVFVFSIISTIVHEVGHLIFGTLAGFKFLSLRIYSYVWHKENDLVKFSRNKSGYLGSCTMVPPENISKLKILSYYAGGSMLNLMIGVIIFLIYMYVQSIDLDDGFRNFLNHVLPAGFMYNTLIALINIIPVFHNDGFDAYAALKSEDATRSFSTSLIVESELAKGRRYSDFEESMFHVDSDAELNNHHIAYLVMLNAYYYLDLKDYDAFLEQLNRLNLEELPRVCRQDIKLNNLFCYLVYKPDLEVVKNIIEGDKHIQKILKSKSLGHPLLIRTMIAYEYVVMKNRSRASELLISARQQIKTYPNIGKRQIEEEHLNNLDEYISS